MLCEQSGYRRKQNKFHIQFAEVSILALQVFKLGRAHKGEVRRIEEEHAPLAEKILIGDFDEIVLLECIQFKFANFLPLRDI